jgi:hypothetical protein
VAYVSRPSCVLRLSCGEPRAPTWQVVRHEALIKVKVTYYLTCLDYEIHVLSGMLAGALGLTTIMCAKAGPWRAWGAQLAGFVAEVPKVNCLLLDTMHLQVV